MLDQTFQSRDLLNILILFFLEGILSVDNAIVLGILVKRMPELHRRRALSYGLGGAFLFRLIAVIAANWLLRVGWVRVVGGAYLIYVTARYFLGKDRKHCLECDPNAATPPPKPAPFWAEVATIELTDIAFALDSILAAIALVSDENTSHLHRIHPKLWVIMTGGMLGVIMVRFAAAAVVRLLDRLPRLEPAAHILILLVGVKLILDWGFNRPNHEPGLNFHSIHSPAFWIFWGAMLLTLLAGLLPKRSASLPPSPAPQEMSIP